LRLAHLGEDLVGFRVGRLVKVHPQLHLSAVRVEGVHVVHVVDAADLLFDRRGHRLLYRHGIGARIGRGDNNFRRCNIREEGNWQEGQGNDPNDRRKDRHDNGQDRAVNKESGHRYRDLAAAEEVQGIGFTS
jgi:hypothetical protein